MVYSVAASSFWKATKSPTEDANSIMFAVAALFKCYGNFILFVSKSLRSLSDIDDAVLVFIYLHHLSRSTPQKFVKKL